MTSKKRNLALPLGIISALLAFGVLFGIYFMAPSNYLAIDVNPSIEIHTNRLDKVTSINPVNEDAIQLMAGYELTDKNLETVIKNIVDRMILNGYLAPAKDNQILITTEDKNTSAQLSEDVDTIILTYLQEKQLVAYVLQQNIEISTQSLNDAHENYVSAGKMAIINKIIENGSSLTVAELSLERISTLVTMAEEKNIDLTGLVQENDNQVDVEDVNEEDSQNDGDSEDQQDDQNDIDNEDQQDDQDDIDDDQQDDQDDIDDEDQQDDQDDIDSEDQQDDQDDDSGSENSDSQDGEDDSNDSND